jgi:L-ascorbate metabolism protein UlaG (beta-lactamase superfamily)
VKEKSVNHKKKHSKISNHYDGKFYHNQFPSTAKRKLKDVLYWLVFHKHKRWPRQTTLKSPKIPVNRVKGPQIDVTFINHSTLLIQIGGINILTDPIWSYRCSPFKWLGPRRVALPGIKFEDLPPIDIVLISHNHYDHMDLPTIKLLNKMHHPQFVVSLGNQKYLQKHFIQNVIEMDWWQEMTLSLGNTKLVFVPAQHSSGRGLFDQNKTLWGGFVLEIQTRRIYFAGDTSYGFHFKHIREKYGAIDLALLPIGTYKPSWFMSPVHMSPHEAVKAHLDLEADQSIGMHFGTFQLSDESIDSPIRDLKEALRFFGLPESKFVALNQGEQVSLSF